MSNRELSHIFEKIGDFLEAEEVRFKPQAYHRAARSIKDLDLDVAKIYKKKGREGLEEIPGVGKSIAEKIEEYIKSGTIDYYEKLRKKSPFDIEEITRVEGMGPKRAKKLYEELEVRDLEDLEKAAREGKIAPLPGFGEKTEKNIIRGLEFLKESKGRFLLGEILPEVERLEKEIGSLLEVERISVAGSIRRKKETIGDIDFLVSLKNPGDKEAVEKVMNFFTELEGVVRVWGKGPTKSSIRLEEGYDVDLRIVPPSSFGSALQYFTGSKDHNIVTRGIAKKKGLKLSEYGLFRGEEKVGGETEEEIYEALGMDYIPPEIRTNEGEVEAALKGRLPRLVGYKEIRGDLHNHSSWNGGVNTIREMAEKARSMGYEYMGISDHTKFLKIENGLNEKELSEQRKEIDKLNKEFKKRGFKILQGAETNILKDGSLDIDDEALARLDYVIGGVHSHFGMGGEEMTERVIKAIKNPYVNIISHPTGRLLKRRKEFALDFEMIIEEAKKNNVALEVNSSPVRLDLCSSKVRQAVEAGVKVAVNTDSHNTGHMQFMHLGVAQARRGWAEKKDVLNSWKLDRLLDFFKKK